MPVDWDDYAPGLADAFADLGTVQPLAVLEDIPSVLSVGDRRTIVDQAEFGLRNIYAHLPLKRARHAVDPLRGLSLLSRRIDDISDREFHSEMMAIFNGLGDIHTSYRPPHPHDRMIAFLPFMVERYFEAKTELPRYVVTRVLGGFTHEHFKPGVEVTMWSGVPIDEAVRRISETSPGGNVAAEMALAVQYLTVRWLGTSLPPRERWVIVEYRDGSEVHEVRLPWALLMLDPDHPDFQVGEQAVWMLTDTHDAALNSCINTRTHVEHVARRRLFAGDKVEEATRSRKGNTKKLQALTAAEPESVPSEPAIAPPGRVPSLIPEMFEASVLQRGDRDYGYIRIRAFAYEQDAFVAEFFRLISLMPKRGLVLDVRGNPGGTIQCAERILQSLTPRPVAPLGFQFIGTGLTKVLTHPPPAVGKQMLAKRQGFGQAWGTSIDVALDTGAVYSKSAPLTPPDEANAVGQLYYGPVVLITDAITYSSGDMFAAGFQDLEIGPILGVDATTGAGGANLWSHAQLVELLPDVKELQPLPGDVEITYAVRRAMRGGKYAGMPIEELGVRPDAARHLLTRRDVLAGNEDLLDAAMNLVDDQPELEFNVVVEAPGAALVAKVESIGVDRLDIYVDDRPQQSVDCKPGEVASLALDVDSAQPHVVAVQGFRDGNLVASARSAYSPR